MLEQWRKVWRDGMVGQLSTPGLEALARALRTDDPRLIQGGTTSPPPLRAVLHWPVEGACLVGFCGWQGDGLETVAEVEKFFAGVCSACDQAVSEPAGCRWTLNWFDETPRDEMRAALLPEVERALASRTPGAVA
jgi:hypothetical protein